MSTASALILTMALAANSDVVLLQFTAEWCGPCRVMEPTVSRLVSAGYPVRKIDVDRDAQTASRFRVTGVPCFVMLVNGEEVERVTGPVSHDRLVQMYGKAQTGLASRPVPATKNVGSRGGIVRGQSPDAYEVGAPSTHSTSANPGAPAMAPPSGSAQHMPPAARTGTTQSPTARGIDPTAVRAAYQASVRLKVEDPQGHGYGTGTIIDSHGSEALVVTCGHLFRESSGKGAIYVDLFDRGQPRTVPGQLISYDLDRDIALVSITPGQPVAPVKVAASGKGIARGAAVFSIGCDKGEAPSVRESHVTAIDRYLGAPNIEVAGQPIDGRSGGGLFSGDGQLIGICNAADPADNEGIYASLPTIHWELDRIGQRRVYASNEPAQLAQGPAAPAPSARVPRVAPPTMPERMVPVAASHVAPQDQHLNNVDGDTEVICIIRSRNDPRGQQKLLVLDRPSADLLARLRQESQPNPAAALLARQPTAPRGPGPDAQRRGNEPVIRAQSADH